MNYPILYKKGTTDFSTMGDAIFKNASEVFIKEVKNGEYTAEFDLPLNDDILTKAGYDDFVKIDGQIFRIRSISASRDSEGNGYSHIKCFHLWYDACDCKYIPHAFTKSGDADIDGWINVTPRWVMEEAFKDTPFYVGDVEIDTPTDIFATKSNPAEIVSLLIDNVGGYLKRDNYTVNLRKCGDSFNGKTIIYGKNLTSIEKTMDESAIITRLYPLGQDDMDISSVNGGKAYIDSPLINSYGYIRCGYKNYPDISDPQKLLEKALSEWSDDKKDGIDKPQIEYAVETYDFAHIAIGDTVRVVDTELGTDILTDVEEITIYPYEPHKGSMVLSNRKGTTSSITDKIIDSVANLEKITDKNGNIMSQYIDNVREKMQSVVDEQTAKRLTVHEFGDMWVDNLANPTKAMIITDGVFAVANSKKENGDWDWRTIGTADKFTADSINAQWLGAGFIDTDKITIRSSDGGAVLSGNSFTISTADGFEATMSSDEGFKYIYNRDEFGNPYDYVILDHKGQKRYWHGQRIPSNFQFAKGQIYCHSVYGNCTDGAVELKGASWLEIAKLYNKILSDENLTDFEKYNLINTMIRCTATPITLENNAFGSGADFLACQFRTVDVGAFTVPKLIEIHSEGTEVVLGHNSKTFYFDGAMLLIEGSGGYVRENGSLNYCYGLNAAYDIAITSDIDYE